METIGYQTKKVRNVTQAAENIKLIGLDVDGVLTDGRVIYDSFGNETKQFSVRDGAAIYYAGTLGFIIAIITGRKCPAVERRAEELRVQEVHQRVLRKWFCMQEIMSRHEVSASEIAYFGDDLIDLQVMTRIGLPIAPADAAPEVKAIAGLITESCGGQGAVREGIEYILKAQGHWDRIVEDACNGIFSFDRQTNNKQTNNKQTNNKQTNNKQTEKDARSDDEI